MKTVLKWGLRLVALALIAVLVLGLWKREELTRLYAVNTLFEPDTIVGNFSKMDGAFPSVEMKRGAGPITVLPKGAEIELPANVIDWAQDRKATSLLILRDGEIVFEEYYQGTGAQDRRISWSMAKSYLSALFGIVVAQGTIPDLDAAIADYVPELTGTGYDGASIRNLLQMSSGIAFNEDYLDYYSDINRMGRVLALGGTMDGFAASLEEKARAPGQQMEYISIDTHVLGMVLRAATGRDIPDLMEELLISKMGLEADPYYITDGEGVAFALGGLNLMTRDYARFGLMYAQEGQLNGKQIVPSDWVRQSTQASAPILPGTNNYGYQWWLLPDPEATGIFMARGVYGQYIYIDRDKQVVIVLTAADRRFREPGRMEENEAIFAQIVDAL